KSKLLYVDDEPLNLYIFEFNFRKNFDVITCISGFKGLELLKSNPEIQIVVSDISMPGMNGIEFITQAKSEFPDISFFILTGYDITDDIQKALDGGLIYKYFRKPLNAKEISAAIEQAYTYKAL
ncbi:MAG: response regulator, partial [Deltaproteobacteria bacterium]|nr:response regulator [Deltaproteobacteria bacterium]